VLLPHGEPGQRYRVLYVLPVEPKTGTYWGDPLSAIQKDGLHQRFHLICVYPTFAQMPWYADHPSDRGVRQESHLLKAVLPWVEGHYPVVAQRCGRLLLGFSKSGWGAWSLILRHGDLFARAAAWDAPLAESSPSKYGMGPIFGTQENFALYQISKLLQQHASEFRQETRLVLTGYGNFRPQHQTMHQQMVELGIRHEYRDGPLRKHHWESGWLPEAIELLAQ